MGRPKGSLNKNTGAGYFSAAQGKRPVSAKPENFGEQISKTDRLNKPTFTVSPRAQKEFVVLGNGTAKDVLAASSALADAKGKREKDLELKVAEIIHDECGVPGCWAKFHQETARQIINLLRIEGV